MEMPQVPSARHLVEVPSEEGITNGQDLYADLNEYVEQTRNALEDLDEALEANPDADRTEAKEAKSYAENQLKKARSYMENTDRLLTEAIEKTSAAIEESEHLLAEWEEAEDTCSAR